jgi:hypothetical protein
MAVSSGPDDRDRLDELAERFAAADYAPEGAEVHDHGGHDEHGEHGHPHGGDDHGHEHGGPTVREFEYRGHTVRIVTHYEVTIDGEPWTQSIQVRPDGTVVSHDLPAYLVPSAADLLRAVIDQSYEAPEEIREMVEETRREEG